MGCCSPGFRTIPAVGGLPGSRLRCESEHRVFFSQQRKHCGYYPREIRRHGSANATGFDDFSPLADRDYSDCDEVAADHARLLENIMHEYGFTAYFREWWHFSDNMSYAVENTFDPSDL